MMPHAPQPGPGAAAPTAVLRDLRTMIEQIGPPTDSDSSGLPPCVGGEDPRWELTPGVVARWCLGPETEDGLLPPWPPAGAAAPAAVSPVMPVAAQQPEPFTPDSPALLLWAPPALVLRDETQPQPREHEPHPLAHRYSSHDVGNSAKRRRTVPGSATDTPETHVPQLLSPSPSAAAPAASTAAAAAATTAAGFQCTAAGCARRFSTLTGLHTHLGWHRRRTPTCTHADRPCFSAPALPRTGTLNPQPSTQAFFGALRRVQA